MTIMLRKATFCALTLLASSTLFGQEQSKDLQLEVTADKGNWQYNIGEVPVFKIRAVQNGKVRSDVKVKYTLGAEKMEPQKTDSLALKNGEATIKGYSLQSPGFLRLTVTTSADGKPVKQMATAAFNPLQIQPTVILPSDFNTYWENAKRELAAVPMKPVVEPMESLSTATVSVYQVSIPNFGGGKIYGILSVPKKEGKHPAALMVPGAGVRGYKGDVALAEKGVITLQIGIHGVPVNLPDVVYEDLRTAALKNYPTFNLDNKDEYYYKRVYLGCVRALDFLVSQESYDGKNLAVYGGSQGGALSIVTAALDNRVKYLAAYYPALSDMTGYLFDRAGGWPHYFSSTDKTKNNSEAKLNTVSYYDVVNFAKQLKVPGYYSWGFNDETCPPTSMYAAYNSISAPKELTIYKETGHFTIQEQREGFVKWLAGKLLEQ